MSLFLLAIAPAFLLLAYVYFRDKYEKEPLGLILRGFFAGAVIIIPVAMIERWLMQLNPGLGHYSNSVYEGFIVAGGTEEFFKFSALYLLFWRNRNFNERYDGIVYAVSISLGFAAIENIFYVYQGSYHVGLVRAFTAVPGHTLFGVLMGYYLGLARFIPVRRNEFLAKSLVVPFLFHGAYDFMLLSGHPVLLIGFIPFLIILWRIGLKRMKQHVDTSIFRNTPPSPPGTYNHD